MVLSLPQHTQTASFSNRPQPRPYTPIVGRGAYLLSRCSKPLTSLQSSQGQPTADVPQQQQLDSLAASTTSNLQAAASLRQSAVNGHVSGIAGISTLVTQLDRSQDSSDSDDPSASSSSQSEDTLPPAPPETRAQKARAFANRVLFGAMLGVGGAFVVLYGKLPTLVFVTFVIYQATQEYYGFITSKGISKGMTPPPPLVSAATTVLCISMALISYFLRGRSGTVLAVATFVLLVMEVVAIKKPKFSQLASSLFGLFYCGWLPSFWLKLRMLSAPAPAVPFASYLDGITKWSVGLVATLTVVACIVAADTGAFFVGKSFGKTKLTDISPKKTVEGAVGGLAGSVGVALAAWKVLRWPATPVAAVILGVILFFSSLFGDLIESIMKREAGMKDSGDLIPGHGGLLDRFDSYIFSGAVAYFYVVFILPVLPF